MLSASLEDYLEVISDLSVKNKSIRVTDIAHKLDVKKPSVNFALKKLAELDLIEYKPYKPVILTNKGKDSAKKVSQKHDLLFKFLSRKLKVSSQTAQEDACKMEHAISKETFNALVKFMNSV